jgi:hypothetical protein
MKTDRRSEAFHILASTARVAGWIIMRGQQNIVVSVILVLVVLGLLAYTITSFQGRTTQTVDQIDENWGELLEEIKKV